MKILHFISFKLSKDSVNEKRISEILILQKFISTENTLAKYQSINKWQ